jgi:sugar O-acyltransferase (sialic acid O-acetyltransferase NeuD family)
MTRRYLVTGASGHAQEVAWALGEQTKAQGEACEFLFFDDRIVAGPLASGLGSVRGPLDAVAEHARGGEARLVLGIGLPGTKMAVVRRLTPLGLPWATVVHPAAMIGPNVSIGEGSYVGAGAIATVNVRIGRFATVNMHCQVAHDDVLGDFVTLHPDVHLAGRVVVGEGAELGTGAVVIPGATIGPQSSAQGRSPCGRSAVSAHTSGCPPAPSPRAPAERSPPSRITGSVTI